VIAVVGVILWLAIGEWAASRRRERDDEDSSPDP